MTKQEFFETLNEEFKEFMLNEAPHVGFTGVIPKELSFLHGRMVDLNFETYNPKNPEFAKAAFYSKPISIPNTNYVLVIRQLAATIEEGESLLILPDNWKRYVLVSNYNNVLTYIGYNVREDQKSGIDFSKYNKGEDGWILV